MNATEACLGAYDVVVCGGGVSGVMAASAAAMQGASTLLLEQGHFLGGTATQSLVSPVSKIRMNGQLLITGLPWTLLTTLADMGGADISYESGNVVFDTELYKLCAQRLVLGSGAMLRLGMVITGARTTKTADGQTRVTEVLCHSKQGPSRVEARYVIDCTGDADIARWAGMPVVRSVSPDGEQQPMTLWFRLGNVDLDALPVDYLYPRAADKRHFNQDIRTLLQAMPDAPTFGGPWIYTMLRDGFVTVNLTRHGGDATDPAVMTDAICQMREDIARILPYLRAHAPGFEGACLVDTGAQVGVRETFRIDGLDTLTEADVLAGREFPDAIAWGAHPVDMHRTASGKQDIHFVTRPYSTPYGTLIPKGSENLLVAGRTLSADRGGLAAMRVQSTCMMTGQAAGLAVADCIRGNVAVASLRGCSGFFPMPSDLMR